MFGLIDKWIDEYIENKKVEAAKQIDEEIDRVHDEVQAYIYEKRDAAKALINENYDELPDLLSNDQFLKSVFYKIAQERNVFTNPQLISHGNELPDGCHLLRYASFTNQYSGNWSSDDESCKTNCKMRATKVAIQAGLEAGKKLGASVMQVQNEESFITFSSTTKSGKIGAESTVNVAFYVMNPKEDKAVTKEKQKIEDGELSVINPLSSMVLSNLNEDE